MSKQENVKKLYEMIKDIKVAMLTTVSEDGSLQSHPMTTQKAAFEGDLWFFLSNDSEAAESVRRNPQVNLSYVSTDENTFVSVTGTGMLIDQRDKMEKHWNPAYKYWFPDGLDSPKLVMLKVTAHSAQYWDSASNPIKLAFEFVKGLVTGDRDDLGDNEELNL